MIIYLAEQRVMILYIPGWPGHGMTRIRQDKYMSCQKPSKNVSQEQTWEIRAYHAALFVTGTYDPADLSLPIEAHICDGVPVNVAGKSDFRSS
jgi:hypothetical protein